METVENKNIRQKINAVTDLPVGYTPNLESKWDLLEAGFNKKENKAVGFYIRYISGIAAALLLIGGAGLYIIKNNKPVARQVQQASAHNEPAVIPVIPAGEKKTAKKRKETNRIYKETHPVKTEFVIHEITPLSDSVDQPATIIPAQLLLTSDKKTARFVELDFNEPVITDQAPSPVVVESKRFRFRIGSGSESNAGVQSANPSSLMLRKAFN
ncbi:MAG: hypothetical protein V4658_03690 [Bacteroidota bacterium]